MHDEANPNNMAATKIVIITLTESFAMLPTSAVSGWYFAHPDAKHFGFAKI